VETKTNPIMLPRKEAGMAIRLLSIREVKLKIDVKRKIPDQMIIEGLIRPI
jgi:hypothetical protein